MKVEVVYACPESADVVTVELPPGATVRDVLEKSGLMPLARGKIGIFGKVVHADARVADGDRIEIYRPLALDPKEARRRRARARR